MCPKFALKNVLLLFFKNTIIVPDYNSSIRITPSKLLFNSLKVDYTEQGKEGNVLFNNALNTFYFTVIWRRT